MKVALPNGNKNISSNTSNNAVYNLVVSRQQEETLRSHCSWPRNHPAHTVINSKTMTSVSTIWFLNGINKQEILVPFTFSPFMLLQHMDRYEWYRSSSWHHSSEVNAVCAQFYTVPL